MKILIIEDNLTLLNSISSSLQEEKFLCETSADFDSAHEKIFLYEYDIVVVDINLPGGSGLEIIRELKKVQIKTKVCWKRSKRKNSMIICKYCSFDRNVMILNL